MNGNTSAVLTIDISAHDCVAATSTGNAIPASVLIAIILAVGAIVIFSRRREGSDEPVQK